MFRKQLIKIHELIMCEIYTFKESLGSIYCKELVYYRMIAYIFVWWTVSINIRFLCVLLCSLFVRLPYVPHDLETFKYTTITIIRYGCMQMFWRLCLCFWLWKCFSHYKTFKTHLARSSAPSLRPLIRFHPLSYDMRCVAGQLQFCNTWTILVRP